MAADEDPIELRDDDDEDHAPRSLAMRALRSRVTVTAVVLVFAAALVATMALPSYSFGP